MTGRNGALPGAVDRQLVELIEATQGENQDPRRGQHRRGEEGRGHPHLDDGREQEPHEHAHRALAGHAINAEEGENMSDTRPPVLTRCALFTRVNRVPG